MAYFDVRPSSHVPTIELRVCDACPIVDDAILIAGLFRALVAEAELALERPAVRSRPAPLHRAAMWRAARSGLAGDLLDDSARPKPVRPPRSCAIWSTGSAPSWRSSATGTRSTSSPRGR